MKVRDLHPGDIVTSGGSTATYVHQTDHPYWPLLRLVIWRMPDGSVSLDALSSEQEVGDVAPQTRSKRAASLRAALLGEALR